MDSIFDEIKARVAEGAQIVYDEWDNDGVEPGFGICDEIANEICSVMADYDEIENVCDGGHDGDDHAWIMFEYGARLWGCDIPYWRYESGGGFSWVKLPNVVFTADMVEIFEI